MSKKNLNDMYSILSTINSLDSKAKKTQKLNESMAESDSKFRIEVVGAPKFSEPHLGGYGVASASEYEAETTVKAGDKNYTVLTRQDNDGEFYFEIYDSKQRVYLKFTASDGYQVYGKVDDLIGKPLSTKIIKAHRKVTDHFFEELSDEPYYEDAYVKESAVEEGKCSSCGCEECECSDMDEGNAFTGKLAHTKHGEKFELGGRSYKDTSSLEEGKEFCEGYHQLVNILVTRVADSLGAPLSNKQVNKLIREATELVVYDWCDFDYDKDREWLELIADIKAGSKHGKDLVDAVESQMNFMGTLDKVEQISRRTYKDTSKLEEGTCTECGMYEDMCECGSGMYEDDLYENCSVDSYSNTEQDNLSINTSYSTRDNRKFVTISAEGEQAEALLQMLKLAGLTHTEHAQRAQALVIAQEAKDYGNTEVDEPEEHSNTPRPKHADVDMIKKMGADLNRPKKQFADKPKAGDNPMATHESIDPLKTLGRDLMKMYKGIQK